MSNYRLIEGAAQLAVSPEHRSSSAARDLSVAILAARFNEPIVAPMIQAAVDAWQRHGGDPARVTVVRVPGAFELPLAAKQFAESRRYDCLVALGCVIRGDTSHFEYVAGAAASGISQAAYDTGVPIAFGVLTVETLEQAIERASPDKMNKGAEALETAIEMALLLRQT